MTGDLAKIRQGADHEVAEKVGIFLTPRGSS
jgi:hypothetical protein